MIDRDEKELKSTWIEVKKGTLSTLRVNYLL